MSNINEDCCSDKSNFAEDLPACMLEFLREKVFADMLYAKSFQTS